MHDLLTPVAEFEQTASGSTGWTPSPGVAIDLHCHSTYSDETLRWLPGLVYHPLLTPGEIYDLAKSRGMDFVTITDHDTIDGCKALLDERGDLADFIIGEEISTRFPEDGTIVHVNAFGLDDATHAEIVRLRDNIYDLADYLRRRGLLYVLNHMTWTEQHRVLQRWQIEKMLELFDVFEGINGTRSYAHNAFAWYAVQGRDKVLVAGSDSHTNRVGTSYTLTAGATRRDVLANIRAGQAAACGEFGTPEKLREDVWLVLSRNVERRLAEAQSRWDRFVCRAIRSFGQAVYPLVCLGYHTKQNMLIRDFVRALPA